MGALFPSQGVKVIPNSSSDFYALYGNVANTEIQLPMSSTLAFAGFGVIRGAGGTILLASGATGARPAAGTVPGKCFFDTTLNVPIWSNGTVWVDAFGNPI